MTFDLEAYKARICQAAGARELKELEQFQKPKRQRARGCDGDSLKGCGCLPEDEECKAFVRWADSMGVVFHWTRSERKESARLRAWAKARGFRDGIPDFLCLTIPGLMIEMKAECSRHTLSDSQKRTIPYMRKQGWVIPVTHGVREAIVALVELGHVQCDVETELINLKAMCGYTGDRRNHGRAEDP